MSDKFVAPKPTFNLTSNPNVLQAITPGERKDTTPSLSVVERLEQEGHTQLAALLAQAQEAAREHATVAETQTRVRVRKSPPPTDELMLPIEEPSCLHPFSPEDIVDDREFIKRTRDGNYHSPEMKALFYANGGERFMQGSVSYAAAFDLLRQDKMRNLRPQPKPATPVQPKVAAPIRTYTPGVPTIKDRQRRLQAEETRTRLVVNEKWAGIERDEKQDIGRRS
jgi:hypothetical protein